MVGRSSLGTRCLLVLALVASLVVVVPAVAPDTLPGAAPSAAASTFPAPAMSLPPCEVLDDGSQRGGCERVDGWTVSVGGRVTEVGSTLSVSGGGFPACTYLYNNEADQSPNPCHTSVGTSVSGCLVYDLWADGPRGGAGSGCGASFSESAETSRGTRGSCDGSGSFGTYIYGGPANQPGHRWSEWSAGLETACTLTVTSMPDQTFDGPAWVRVTQSASGWRDYYSDDRAYVTVVADQWVPVDVEVRNRGPIVECDGEDLGGGNNRFFVSDMRHPLGLGVSYEWWYGDGESGEEQVGSGSSIEFSFPGDALSRHVTLRATDTDSVTTSCSVSDPEPSSGLDVTLARDGQDPVVVDEPFDVDLTVAAPGGNPDDVVGITADPLVELPAWLELVDGSMPGGFDLAPGEHRSTTLRLRATDAQTDTISSTWAGLADGEDVSATGQLEIEVVGRLDGEWFRQDQLGEYVREGDTVDVRLRIENETRQALSNVTVDRATVGPAETSRTGDPGDVVGVGAVVIEEPTTCPEASTSDDASGDGAERAEAVLTRVSTSTLRGSLDATGPGSVDFLDFTLEGVEPGEVLLCAEVAATAASGDEVEETIEATWEVKEVGLDVDITPMLERPDGSTPELNTDNDGDGDIDLDDHRVDVEVVVTNTTEDQVTDLHFLDEAEPIDWSNNLVGEDQGAPRLTLMGVRGDPTEGPDGQVPGPIEELDVEIPDLAAAGEEGSTHTVTLVYEATGEVDADGQSVVLGAQDQATVRGSGEAELSFLSGLLLEFTTWLKEPDRLTTSGQVIRMGGHVTNLDEDEVDESGAVTREAKPIIVWITPLLEGNASGGHLVTRDGGRTPTGAEFIEVPPGETVDLHGIVATLASPRRTDAEMTYRIDAWNKPETAGDAANPIAPERIDVEVDEENGWGDEHTKRLVLADTGPDDITACETQLYDAIVTCNFYEGLTSLYFNTVDAAKMAKQGIGEIGSSTYWVGAWAMRELADVAAALDDDEAARARLAQELEVQLSTWYDMSILAGEAGVSAVGVLDQFIGETHRVLREGDTEAGLAWVSKFAGENPDLLFSAVLKARTLAAMGQAALRGEARSAAGTIVRETVEAEGRAAAREINQNVEQAIARGVDPKAPSSGALRSGLDVTDSPKVWRDVYGAARQDIENLLRIAREEGILIAFRSRNPISIKLLEDGLAWLKPQSVKAKNVNAIDVTYLGFPQDAFGKVVMMEPPINFNLKGHQLENALDVHMGKLKQRHPELAADPVWAGEVRDRLKLRVTKYREHLSEWLSYAHDGMPVGFDGAANGVRKGGLNVTEYRDVRVEVTMVDNPYGPGQLERYDLKVAGPGGTDYRHLTGDIDIVGFFNLDRTPIMGEAKRARIYEKMRSLLGMQHGETLTWNHRKRAEILRSDHIGADSELLVVVSPNERLYLSELDEAKSSEVFAGDNFKDTFSLLDGPPAELRSPQRGPGPAASGSLLPLSERQTEHAVQALERFKQPAEVVDRLKKIAEQSDGQITVEEQQSADGPPVVVRPDGTIVIYRVPDGTSSGAGAARTRQTAGAPSTTPSSSLAMILPAPAPPEETAPLAGDTDPAVLARIEAILGDWRHEYERPAVGRLGGHWEQITFEEAAAAGDPGVIELPVTSWTDMPIRAGDTSLSVLTAGDLGLPDGAWFQAGDTVVVDPGGAYEQVATLTEAHGHVLTLEPGDALLPDEPLDLEVPAGVQVLLLDRDTSASPGGVGGGHGGGGGPVESFGDGSPACPADQVPVPSFEDLGDVHGDRIACLAWWGIAQGVDAAHYLPRRDVTRAEMASFVARVLARAGVVLPVDPPDAFSDDAASVHEQAIDQLAALGVVEGFRDGGFHPLRPLTRGEVAALLVRALDRATGQPAPADRDWFSDDDGGVFEAVINAARGAGLTGGWTATTYRPATTVTRGQVAGFLANLLDHLVAGGVAHPPGLTGAVSPAGATRSRSAGARRRNGRPSRTARSTAPAGT